MEVFNQRGRARACELRNRSASLAKTSTGRNSEPMHQIKKTSKEKFVQFLLPNVNLRYPSNSGNYPPLTSSSSSPECIHPKSTPTDLNIRGAELLANGDCRSVTSTSCVLEPCAKHPAGELLLDVVDVWSLPGHSQVDAW